MKRKEIIEKLMNEGFTEKTLVNMNDKQLGILCDRILSEQITSAVSTSTVPKKSPDVSLSLKDANLAGKAAKLSRAGISFAATEGEIKEEKKEDNDNLTLKRIRSKIQRCIKDGKSYSGLISLVKKINNGKIPENIQKLIDEKPKNNKELKEWVNKLVENNCYSFTSKKEISELVQSKLNEIETMQPMPTTKAKKGHNGIPEFMTYDAIVSSAAPAEPITRPSTPTTKPNEKPRPKHPLQPGITPNPKPKAGIKIKK